MPSAMAASSAAAVVLCERSPPRSAAVGRRPGPGLTHLRSPMWGTALRPPLRRPFARGAAGHGARREADTVLGPSALRVANSSMGPSVVAGLRSVEKTRLVIEKLLGDVIVATLRRP